MGYLVQTHLECIYFIFSVGGVAIKKNVVGKDCDVSVGRLWDIRDL